jgi:hypothetical protein
LVCDILHFDRQVPTVAHDRQMELGPIAAARRAAPVRISWPIVFMKAFALMASRHPVLRQVIMPWPWPHLYQHSEQVAVLAIRRTHEQEDWLLFGRFRQPEQRALADLQAELDHYQRAPVPEAFAQQLLLARMPLPLRRLTWNLLLKYRGGKRCRRMGTFFMTTIAGYGAEIQNPPAFHTSGLTYGPLDAGGRCRVTMVYDHRLMDGHHVGGYLAELEQELLGTVRRELQQPDRQAA